jgi:DNA primase
MPGVDFNVLRQRISMADVLQLLKFEASSQRGAQLRGACPVHGSSSGRSRSFSVNVRLGRYHCFGCGSRGNALELWSAARGLGIREAALELSQLLGQEVPWSHRS